ncbi:unnamed protein product, partial [Rotaria magnacalcarata]
MSNSSLWKSYKDDSPEYAT